jgi:ornithine--oxo-acid transaminase
LVIEEADLRKAIKLIEECLNELDELDHIPGDEGQEHGTVIGLED